MLVSFKSICMFKCYYQISKLALCPGHITWSDYITVLITIGKSLYTLLNLDFLMCSHILHYYNNYNWKIPRKKKLQLEKVYFMMYWHIYVEISVMYFFSF